MDVSKPDGPRSRPRDTSDEIWKLALRKWRDAGPVARAEACNAASKDLERLVLAGILADEPDADPERVLYLLTRRRYGPALADAARRARSSPPR